MNVPDFAVGEELSAAKLNALARAVRRGRLRVLPPIQLVDTPDGGVLYLAPPQEADWRITSGANPYAATEQTPTAGGGWSDMPDGRVVTASAGGDGLFERAGVKTVAVGTVVRAARNGQSGAWIFDRASCTTSATTPTTPQPAPQPAPLPSGPSRSPGFDLGGEGGGKSTAFAPTWASLGLQPIQSAPLGGSVGVSSHTGGGP